MIKRLCPYLVLCLVFTLNVLASSLTLDTIGALSTSGKKYSEWWYTAQNPTLTGKAEDDQKVKIIIDDKTKETKANSSGRWTQATTMTNGKHSVKIVAGAESYAFTLNIGSAMPSASTASTSQSSAAVPGTGFHQMYFILVAIYLLILGAYFYHKNFVKEAFEKKVLH